jgi:catechol 2,3-dioxygenase
MGELPASTRLGAIRLRAADLGLLQDFYERAIGLRAIPVDEDVAALGAGDGRLVELVAHPDAPPRPPRTTGLFHLALLVPTRAELARALRRVLRSGWHLSGASDHLVSEALYLSDPEGNGIELYRDRPRDEWSRDGGELQMATLPLDLEGLRAEPGGDDETPSLAEGTTLGHVHLQVSELDPAEAFWVDGLGLDVMVRGYPGALFVSAGGYHHHVGLNTWAGVGAPRPPTAARGLDRFDIVLPDAESATAARTRVAALTDVTDADGGFLAKDPSGNAVLVRPEPR